MDVEDQPDTLGILENLYERVREGAPEGSFESRREAVPDDERSGRGFQPGAQNGQGVVPRGERLVAAGEERGQRPCRREGSAPSIPSFV